jgi:hypothetical protein
MKFYCHVCTFFHICVLLVEVHVHQQLSNVLSFDFHSCPTTFHKYSLLSIHIDGRGSPLLLNTHYDGFLCNSTLTISEDVKEAKEYWNQRIRNCIPGH